MTRKKPTLCYRLGETAFLVEDLMVELVTEVKSCTPIDIVFRHSSKEFILYLSKPPDKDDERSIAKIADNAGFSAVVLVSGAYLVTMRISEGGTFIYETSSHAQALARETNETFASPFTIVANNRNTMNRLGVAAQPTEVSSPPITANTKRRRNEIIEERLMDL